MIAPLFGRLPALRAQLGFTQLIAMPSPVDELSRLSHALGNRARILVKRDNLCGSVVRGSKARKCEFFVGAALKQGTEAVLTAGAVGSNHLFALAGYAKKAGLRATCLITSSADEPRASRRYAALEASGARLVACPHRLADPAGQAIVARERAHLMATFGHPPLEVPFGGGGALGALGAVNAALELGEQIRDGTAPLPDRIYVPLATMGMAAGLAVGIALADLPTDVVGVRVVDRENVEESALDALIEKIYGLLGGRAATSRVVHGCDVVIAHEFGGPAYGVGTPATTEAIALARSDELALEETYTAKGMAALVADVRDGCVDGRTILFWNTAPPLDYVGDT